MNDVLDRLMLDPGSRTFGELIQERVLASQEIRRLRDEIERLRDVDARNRGASTQRTIPASRDLRFDSNPIRFYARKS